MFCIAVKVFAYNSEINSVRILILKMEKFGGQIEGEEKTPEKDAK